MDETVQTPAGGVLINHRVTGIPAPDAKRIMVWGHGWGHDLRDFQGIASSFGDAMHVFLDFPGHGASPPPPSNWGTGEYADACAALLRGMPLAGKPVVWIGHSFGGRVGIQAAARHPGLLTGLVLVAGAGLKRKRPPLEALKFFVRVRMFKLSKLFLSKEKVEQLRSKMGSADYRNAGPMRAVFVRVVNEDLSDVARRVACPTLLIYGENDTETPPEFGERYSRLILRSKLVILPQNDHLSVLAGGRHVVAKRLTEFVGTL